MSYNTFMSHANIKKIDEDWKIIKKKIIKNNIPFQNKKIIYSLLVQILIMVNKIYVIIYINYQMAKLYLELT